MKKGNEYNSAMDSMSAEQKKEWARMISRTRNRAHKEGSCGQPDYRKCCGDCEICSWRIQGNVYSLDDINFTGKNGVESLDAYKELAPVANPEDDYAREDTISRIYTIADRIFPNGSGLLRGTYEEGKTLRVIAAEQNLLNQTALYRLQTLLKYLREHRDEFI